MTTRGEPAPVVVVKVGTSVAEMERQLILQTLDWCKDNKAVASRILGISRRTLYNKLAEYAERPRVITNESDHEAW